MQSRKGRKSTNHPENPARDSVAPASAPPASGALPKINTGTRFQSSFDQVAVGIVHTTTDGRILEVNRRLCQLLGYTAAELQP